MRNILCTIMLTAIYCFAFSPSVKAQEIYGLAQTYLSPDETRIIGYAETSVDYWTALYYRISVVGYLYENGIYVDGLQRIAESEGFMAVEVRPSAPYNPGAEYEVTAEHAGEPVFRHDITYELIDFFNYQTWPEGEEVRYPLYFGFLGPGPERPSSIANILLGITYGLFSQGTQHGPPARLKVVSDVFGTEGCGSRRRLLRLQIVDTSGRNAGRVPVVETLYNVDTGEQYSRVYNSCQNNYLTPRGCTLATGLLLPGTFTDQLWVGCPSAGGDCGFPDMISRWWWCPRARPRVRLTSNLYQIRHSYTLINGYERFDEDTILNP